MKPFPCFDVFLVPPLCSIPSPDQSFFCALLQNVVFTTCPIRFFPGTLLSSLRGASTELRRRCELHVFLAAREAASDSAL